MEITEKKIEKNEIKQYAFVWFDSGFDSSLIGTDVQLCGFWAFLWMKKKTYQSMTFSLTLDAMFLFSFKFLNCNWLLSRISALLMYCNDKLSKQQSSIVLQV